MRSKKNPPSLKLRRVKKKKKKCEKCGGPLGSDSIQGYCYTCYEKIWDNGFESTTQHAEEIAAEEEKP